MRGVVKVWNRIVIIISIILCVLGIVFAEESSYKIAIAIILALRVTFGSLIGASLDTRRKSITLGVLSTIFYFPVVGILYLVWTPKNGKTYL